MKYKVDVEPFTVTDTKTVEVEADSLQEACEKAERISDDWVQHGEICWEAHFVEEV